MPLVDPDAVLQIADTLTPAELDALPYGMIQLDAAGRILQYNALESRLAALEQHRQVGRLFFSEVAPCTKVQHFYGRFKEGVLHEHLDVTFDFHFAFKQQPRDGAPLLFAEDEDSVGDDRGTASANGERRRALRSAGH